MGEVKAKRVWKVEVPLAEKLAYNIVELASLMGVSARLLYHLDRDRVIPGRRTLGRRVLFDADTVRAWIKAGMHGVAAWERAQTERRKKGKGDGS